VLSNAGPLGDQSVHAVFRELVSGSRAILEPTRVAYLGPEFTFSHLAALEQFGESVELVPVASIRTVFAEVERQQADFGVVPMENSTDGRVSDTLECFSQSQLRICGELPLRIHHCLMGVGRQDEIEIVHSKPQALSQCRNWLAQHLPSATPRPVGSTAEAAVYARANPKMAAIGSEKAGANYDLKVFARNIEDNADNITRFAVIGPSPAGRSGKDKTALLLEIAHEPGALADTMAIFKRNRLNMTWIESYPIPSCHGRYLFFIEFVGHQKDLRCRRAIESVGKKSVRMEVLGSYAQMEPIG
jgi:chorismate mutase/prephenate dehydratase